MVHFFNWQEFSQKSFEKYGGASGLSLRPVTVDSGRMGHAEWNHSLKKKEFDASFPMHQTLYILDLR